MSETSIVGWKVAEREKKKRMNTGHGFKNIVSKIAQMPINLSKYVYAKENMPYTYTKKCESGRNNAHFQNKYIFRKKNLRLHAKKIAGIQK